MVFSIQPFEMVLYHGGITAPLSSHIYNELLRFEGTEKDQRLFRRGIESIPIALQLLPFARLSVFILTILCAKLFMQGLGSESEGLLSPSNLQPDLNGKRSASECS